MILLASEATWVISTGQSGRRSFALIGADKRLVVVVRLFINALESVWEVSSASSGGGGAGEVIGRTGFDSSLADPAFPSWPHTGSREVQGR